jgi:iron complex outermembrane receptor protein
MTMPGAMRCRTNSYVVSQVLLTCLFLLSISAHAQVRFDLPVQPLSQALRSVGALTNLNILFDASQVDGLQAPALKGEASADDALAQLLAGTPLRAIRVDANTVRVIVGPTTKRAQSSGAAPTGALHASGSVRLAYSGIDVAPPRRPAINNFSSSEDEQGAEASQSSTRRGGLEEVIVTSQKREERLKDVPISISVLGGNDLDRSTVSSVTEALNLIPGVSATEGVQGGGTQIVIRGAGAGEPLFNGSSPVGYYLDSVPFGLVKSAILPDAGVYDLERVEVLRGPQGTLFGASAENGLVRVLTRDANLNEFELKARAVGSTTDGGAGNYAGDLAINVPIVEGKLAIRGVIDYQNLSGWIDSPVQNHVNDAEQRTYRLKLDAQPTDQLSIGLSAWRTRDDFGAPSTSTDDRKNFALLPEPISSGYDAYGLKVGYDLSPFTVTSATSYLDYRNEGILDLRIYDIPVPYPFGTNIYAHVFSQEVILYSAPVNSWHWTAGAFYRNAADRLLQTFPPIYVVPTDFTSGSKSYAAFGQLGRRFLEDKWEWTLGLRRFHDNVSSQENQSLPNVSHIHQTASFNATTPRAILTWHPSRDLTAYTSYSEGFRSGAPQDPNTLRQRPDLPFLKPDKLHNYEIGAKGNLLDGRVSFDLALFYTKWNDVQQSQELPTSTGVGVTALVNSQSASGPGVDLAITARPTDAVELGVTFSWNHLKMDAGVLSGGIPLFRKGDRLNYSSEFTGGGLASYTLPVGRTGFKSRLWTSANYRSRQADHAIANDTTVVNTGEAQFTGRVGVSLLSPRHWTATLFVDNVTNNYGAQPQSLFPVVDLTPRPRPRTFGLQFEYNNH